MDICNYFFSYDDDIQIIEEPCERPGAIVVVIAIVWELD